MGSALADMGHGIEACSLEVGGGLVDTVRILLAARAHEHELGLVSLGKLLNLLYAVGTTAEQTPVAKDVGTMEGDGVRLHATHGEAAHGTVVALCLGAEVFVYIRNEFIAEHLLKPLLDIELANASVAYLIGHAVGHHHNHGLALAISNEVVHDKSGLALYGP